MMTGMPAQPEITERDLRNRSKEIVDALENGRRFTVIHDGRRIGEIIPWPSRRFVSRQEFAATSRGAPAIDIHAFRADQGESWFSRSLG
jgi:antitoxin (DNA-binding transcriptional repressor) of toxin-antitoxin stability system